MEQIGMTKLDTGIHKFSVGKAGGKRKLELLCKPEELPEIYQKQRVEVIIEADKECIMEVLEDDATAIPGVVLHERQNVLRIK
jgi:hypothetical protein